MSHSAKTRMFLAGGGILLIGIMLLLVLLYGSWRSCVREDQAETVLPKTSTPVCSHTSNAPAETTTPSEATLPQRETKALPTPSAVTEAGTAEGTAAVDSSSGTEEMVTQEEPVIVPDPPIPAVFGATPLLQSGTSPAAAVVTDIAQEFTERVKAAGWDTSSQVYQETWEKAAEEADQALRNKLGDEAYAEMQRHQREN